jgi:chromosome segregation ATPase
VSEFIIKFLAAGFQQSFDKLEVELIKRFNNLSTELTQLLDSRTMALLDQINELKAGQEINSAKIQALTDASTAERGQVTGLVNLSQSQQETIAQLTAQVADLLAQLEAGNADNTLAIASITELIAKSSEESAKIDEAIAGIQGIYEPPAV